MFFPIRKTVERIYATNIIEILSLKEDSPVAKRGNIPAINNISHLKQDISCYVGHHDTYQNVIFLVGHCHTNRFRTKYARVWVVHLKQAVVILVVSHGIVRTVSMVVDGMPTTSP